MSTNDVLLKNATNFVGIRSYPQCGRIMNCVSHVLGHITWIPVKIGKDKMSFRQLVKDIAEIKNEIPAEIARRPP